MSKINALHAVTDTLNRTLEAAVQQLENKRIHLKRDYAFIRALIQECDEAGVDFTDKIEDYSYTGGLRRIDRSLLPLVRKVAGCPISKHFSTAEDAKTVCVYVTLKSGIYKDLEFSYLAPAPKGKKCKVKEVEYPARKSFELVCEK